MSRKSSVRVQMADTVEELEDLARTAGNPLAQAHVPPREPIDDPREPTPIPPQPDDDPDDDDDDDDDGPDHPEHAAQKDGKPANVSRYQSRIHIVEAWKYPGHLGEHPAFVDPNWAAWADYDEVRKLEPGPALRVPTPGAHAEKLCRRGDYVVRQQVTLAHGIPAETQIDVWTQEEFERLFLPVSPS